MKNICLAFLFFTIVPDAYSQQYFQQQVNFTINVTLNDIDNTLDGNIKIDYTNNSRDTLKYIWFHLWPNAYKNDRTAFSEQFLQNGRTDFYFSDEKKRGYINRLDFKVDDVSSVLEDHPQYIDVVKLMLPKPLLPGKTIKITTPFHEKIPFNFSRGGYVDQTYQITQWYPKPAVYDRKGWHPMPYLDQGEFYSEFGNFDVNITLPKNYIVATTGDLQNEDEKKFLLTKSKEVFPTQPKKVLKLKTPHPTKQTIIPSSSTTKTLHYTQSNVHDFAWFADKNFVVRSDTLRLTSGRVIQAWSYFPAGSYTTWKNSIQFIKAAVTTRSKWLGEYPYNVVTALEAKMGFAGGMEYPTITSISPVTTEAELDQVIEHEVGHNWNFGILASNERQHPWMDEGINTFYDDKYNLEKKYPRKESEDLFYRSIIAAKKDQPIETPSEKFSELNYNLTAYYKAAQWMKLLENIIGKDVFDKCMHEYFNRWKFNHPYPEDFKKVIEDVSGKNVNSIFALLSKTGPLQTSKKREIKFKPIFTLKQTDKYNYIFGAPIVGFNKYDNFMLGAFIHNYTLPASEFQFFVVPLFATRSNKLRGMSRFEYNWRSYNTIQQIKLSLNTASFSMSEFVDSVGIKKSLAFSKIVPSVKITFRNKNARSTLTKYLQWKLFLLKEDEVAFSRDTIKKIDIIKYPRTNRYVNQFKYVIKDDRVLYPYNAEFNIDQGKNFAKTSLTATYFLNYKKNGGLSVRFFAGKFFYLGDKTYLKQYLTHPYHLTLAGAKGYEDYTYSNYFIGRNEYDKFYAKQIMIRDGGFKVRTDLLSSKIGKTDNWLSALNFKTDLPKKINPLQILPIKIPLKVFFDIGTYAEAWNKDATTGKFLYDAGFQISIIKDLINIYLPVVYSSVYKDYLKSTFPEKKFLQNMSFSIDIHNYNFKGLSKLLSF